MPTPNVSLVILTVQLEKNATAEEVNAALKAASEGPLAGVLGFEEKPLVSCDFLGNPNSSIVDAGLTAVMGGDLMMIQSWYDNEWGFSARMIDMTRLLGSQG